MGVDVLCCRCSIYDSGWRSTANGAPKRFRCARTWKGDWPRALSYHVCSGGIRNLDTNIKGVSRTPILLCHYVVRSINVNKRGIWEYGRAVIVIEVHWTNNAPCINNIHKIRWLSNLRIRCTTRVGTSPCSKCSCLSHKISGAECWKVNHMDLLVGQIVNQTIPIFHTAHTKRENRGHWSISVYRKMPRATRTHIEARSCRRQRLLVLGLACCTCTSATICWILKEASINSSSTAHPVFIPIGCLPYSVIFEQKN